MPESSSNLNHFWAGLMVEELVRNGVEWFVISPGSRSTPLAWAAAEHSKAQTVVHFDERGACFHALGIAKAAQSPAVFICTSGTAVANAFPAVVEASMAHVPLILLTADRPPELQDTGANQTIDQIKIYGDYVRWFHALPCPDPEIAPEYVLSTIDQAVYRSRRPKPGPVQLNCPYREPLEPAQHGGELPETKAWRAGGRRQVVYPDPGDIEPSPSQDLMSDILSTRNGLLVVGQLNSKREIDAAVLLAWKLAWPVIADVSSSLNAWRGYAFKLLSLLAKVPLERDPLENDPGVLAVNEFASKADLDFVLQIGGPITGKALPDLLAQIKCERLVRAVPYADRQDPSHHRYELAQSSLGELEFTIMLVSQYSEDIETDRPKGNGPAPEWSHVNEAIQDVIESGTDTSVLSELSAVRLVTQRAPRESVVFLGNSMPIRWADMYGAPSDRRLFIAANRGASGIDGNIATAAGYARTWEVPVTAVVGDLAALHDINSLALLNTLPVPAVVVVLNNNGGGIFHLLPIADHTEHFERFFATPHGLGFEHLARGFGVQYARPGTNAGFIEAYENAFESGGAWLIEVVADRAESARIHADIQQRIRDTLRNLK